MATAAPTIRARDEGDQRSFLGGGHHTWKLLTEETGGSLFLFEDLMTRGKATPLHRHPEADEVVYVLEGQILLYADGEEIEVGPGGVSFMPRGVPHAFLVTSETARLLTLQTPGVGQPFYRGASDPTTAATSDVLDIPRLQASAAANPTAIELLGPPPFAPG